MILGSSSPRRREIFSRLGIKYKIIAPADDPPVSFYKKFSNCELEKLLRTIVMQKYQSINRKTEIKIPIFCFDTVVFCRGRVLGKPQSRKEAEAMLRLLSGRKHQVITAALAGLDRQSVCLLYKTDVFFRKLSNKDISDYLDCREFSDAAGAYKIQENGMRLVLKIRGCFFNIVGMPLDFICTVYGHA